MELITFMISSTFTRINESLVVDFVADLPKNNIKKVIVMTLDCSGSMEGSAMINGKTAMVNIVRRIIEEDLSDEVLVVTYNDEVALMHVNKNNLKKSISNILSIRARGTTNFINLFNAIIDILNDALSKGPSDFCVSIFTDGRHSDGYTSDKYGRMTPCPSTTHLLPRAIDVFEEAMQKNINAHGSSTTVIACGYSSHNDVQMLNRISNAGTIKGQYKYASESAMIEEILDPSAMLKNSTQATIRIMGCDHVITFTNNHARLILDMSDPVESIKIGICINGELTTVECKQAVQSACEIVDTYIDVLSKEMVQITQSIISAPRDKTYIANLRHNLVKFQKNTTYVTTMIRKIRTRPMRSTYFEKVQKLIDHTKKMNECIARITERTVNNGHLSALLNNGHSLRHISKKSFKNMLNKRITNNIDLLEKENKQIFDLAESKQHIESTMAVEPCYITLSTWEDLIRDGDILCMSGSMARPEVAIADSSRIRFDSINPATYNISFGVFQDAMTDEKSSHGAFSNELNAGIGVIKAMRSKINFAYPLYINGTHWKMASLYIKRIHGWMATLSWAGYQFTQMKVIPFSMMRHTILNMEKENSEQSIQQFYNVARVAYQISVDYNMKSIEDDLDRWIESHKTRTPGNIINIDIFLTKLLFTSRPLGDAFWLTVIEEISRRRIHKLAPVPDFASQHNFKQYVANTVAKSTRSDFANTMLQVMSDDAKKKYFIHMSHDSCESDLKNAEEKVFVADSYQITERMMVLPHKNYVDIEPSIKFMRMIRTLRGHFNTEQFVSLDECNGAISEEHIALKNIFHNMPDEPLITCHQLYVMYIQNVFHVRNAARRENQYINPFSENSHEIIQNVVDKAIRAEKSKREADASMNLSRDYAQIFRATGDLLTAAGILYELCKNQGDSIFRPIMQEMQSCNKQTPHFIAKVKMMTHGEFESVPLYNATDHGTAFRWPASKKNQNRFKLAFKHTDEFDCAPINAWEGVFVWEEEFHGKFYQVDHVSPSKYI